MKIKECEDRVPGEVRQELEEIRKRHHGLLRPDDVVEYARDKETALHRQFTWDDGEAAEMWRVHQARNIIRVAVTVVEVPGSKEPVSVRAYQSLTTDRGGEGYRATVEVLSIKKLRTQMLQDALNELITFRRKYAVLKELARVHEAIDAVTKK